MTTTVWPLTMMPPNSQTIPPHKILHHSAVKTVLVSHQRLIGIGSGRSGADPFVIALAMVHGGTVVTEETLSRNLTKPRIPDVCDAMGIFSTQSARLRPSTELGVPVTK